MTPGVPPRLPLSSQRLVVVTGKGGVGKTTVTAALAHAATAGGRRVLAVEVGRGPLGSLLGRPVCAPVVVAAPASGHSLPLLAAPHTLGALARLGPVAELLARIQRLIADPGATLVCVVTTPEELAVRETMELHRELAERLGLAVAPPIVNALPPRRFTAGDAAARGRPEAASGAHPHHHRRRLP